MESRHVLGIVRGNLQPVLPWSLLECKTWIFPYQGKLDSVHRSISRLHRSQYSLDCSAQTQRSLHYSLQLVALGRPVSAPLRLSALSNRGSLGVWEPPHKAPLAAGLQCLRSAIPSLTEPKLLSLQNNWSSTQELYGGLSAMWEPRTWGTAYRVVCMAAGKEVHLNLRS